MELQFDPLTVLFYAVAFVPAVVLHEVSHGFLAVRLGDLTPKLRGRLTLKPRPHIDAFGTVVVPALLLLPVLFGRGGLVFGYAKAMPIDRSNFRNPDTAMTWIALAGIATNILLAVVGAVGYRLVAGPDLGRTEQFFEVWVVTNILIAVLHLIPVPPLDMSKILARFLPPRARQVYESWEPYGALFVLVILFLIPAPILGIVDPVAEGLISLLL